MRRSFLTDPPPPSQPRGRSRRCRVRRLVGLFPAHTWSPLRPYTGCVAALSFCQHLQEEEIQHHISFGNFLLRFCNKLDFLDWFNPVNFDGVTCVSSQTSVSSALFADHICPMSHWFAEMSTSYGLFLLDGMLQPLFHHLLILVTVIRRADLISCLYDTGDLNLFTHRHCGDRKSQQG